MSKFKKIAILSVAALLLLSTGYVTGRYIAPTKTVVSEKVVQVEKQVVVTQVKTEVQVVRVAEVNKNAHKVTNVVKKPDGSVVTNVVEDTNTDIHKGETANSQTQAVKTEEKIVYQDREVVKTVERAKPSWGISVLPGYDFTEKTSSFIPGIPNHFNLGVSVDRRVVGPVFGGIWANSAGMAGITMKLEF